MGQHLSRPLTYSCYELSHTWTPFCSEAALEIGCSCFKKCLKIYASVYLFSEVMRGKIPDVERLKTVVTSLVQSSLFLSYTCFGFVTGHCLLRQSLGWTNYWTAALVPGWISCLLAMFLERPARRTALATYVTTVASESLFNSLKEKGIISGLKCGEVLLFSVASSVFVFLYRSGYKTNSLYHKILRNLIGEEKKPNVPLSVCDDKGSCVASAVKASMKSFMFGSLGSSAILLYKLLKGKQLKRPRSSELLSLPLFLSSFSLLTKLVLGLLRRARGREETLHGALAGLVGGLSMLFYRSPNISLYLFWKSIETFLSYLCDTNTIPRLPLFTEVVCSTSTAILVHLATMEPHNLKKSYWKFLNSITNNRISEVNRLLIDLEYGTTSAKMRTFKPIYHPGHISPKLKSLLPTVGLLFSK